MVEVPQESTLKGTAGSRTLAGDCSRRGGFPGASTISPSRSFLANAIYSSGPRSNHTKCSISDCKRKTRSLHVPHACPFFSFFFGSHGDVFTPPTQTAGLFIIHRPSQLCVIFGARRSEKMNR
jgi:hypothetical protein